MPNTNPDLIPDVISFQEEAILLGFTPEAAYAARCRKVFPVRVCQIGKKLVCFKVDHDEYIKTRVSQAHLSVPALKKIVVERTGRPTKREAVEAKRLGLSVPEFRAQQKAGVKS